MKSALLKTVAPFFAVSALAPFVVADVEKYLPSGETLALAKIENAAAMNAFFQNDALALELFQKVWKPLFPDVSFSEIFAENPPAANVLSAFRGEVALAALDSLGVVCVADLNAEFDVASLGKEAADFEPTEIGGVPAFRLKEKGDAYAYFAKIGDKLVLALGNFEGRAAGKAAFEKIVLAVKSGTPAGFAESPVFKRSRERIGNADFWCYVDGAAMARAAYAFAEKRDKKAAEEATENPLAAMVAARPIVAALAPEAIDALWWKYSLDAKSDYASEMRLSWNANRGAITLLTSSVKNGFEKPALFPLSDDVVEFGAGNFSLGKFVSALMSLGRQASPLWGIFELQLPQLKAAYGIDIPKTIAAFDFGTASCGFAEPAGGKVFVSNISDEKTVRETIVNSLELSAAVWEEARIHGVPAYVLSVDKEDFAFDFAQNDPAVEDDDSALLADDEEAADDFEIATVEETKIAFAIADGKLFIGAPELIARLLEQGRSGKSSVWESVQFRRAEVLLPPGGCGVSFAHLGRSILSGWNEVVVPVAASGLVVPEIELKEGDLDYSVISKSYLEGNEFITRSRVIKNQ